MESIGLEVEVDLGGPVDEGPWRAPISTVSMSQGILQGIMKDERFKHLRKRGGLSRMGYISF